MSQQGQPPPVFKLVRIEYDKDNHEVQTDTMVLTAEDPRFLILAGINNFMKPPLDGGQIILSNPTQEDPEPPMYAVMECTPDEANEHRSATLRNLIATGGKGQ